ncbi:MAG: hypothetical protein AAGD25_27810 [Cyanobacteria bacterium P01_F01_bin.150]
MTQERLQERLKSLKTEFNSGQQMLAELDNKRANLKETLLRISGAIQVIEELLEQESTTNGESSGIETEHIETVSMAES